MTADGNIARSVLSNCFRCLTPAPADPDYDGPGAVIAYPDHFVWICGDCIEPVQNWQRGEYDDMLGYLYEDR